jgi:hypothetical protein
MMYFPMGGLYCSIMTVERGNAFVLDLIRAITATANDNDRFRIVAINVDLQAHTIYPSSFASFAFSTLPDSLYMY